MATSASTAKADVTDVRVTISSMTPQWSDGSGRLTISGTIQNVSGDPLKSVQVYLWRSMTAITSDEGLQDALQSADDDPTGRRAIDDEQATWVSVTTGEETFEPNRTSSFTVSAPIDRLGFRASTATYLVGVQVRALLPDNSIQTVGRARTFLPVVETTSSVPYTPVVVLTTRPSMVAPAVFADGHLVGDLKGRLRRLINRAAQQGTSFLVDPALVDEVQALTGEVTYLSGKPTQATAEINTLATTWLNDLAELVAGGHGYRLPYGNADLRLTGPDQSLRDRVASATGAANPVVGLPLAVLPRDGAIDAGALDLIDDIGPQVVLASSITGTVHRDAITGLTLVRTDQSPITGGPGPDPRATGVQQVQRGLAQQLVSGLQDAPGVTLIGDDTALALDKVSATWRHARTLDQLAGTAVSTTTTFTESPAPPDPARWLQAETATSEAFAAWGEITGQTEVATVRTNQTLSRGLSTNWASDQQAVGFLRTSAAQVGSLLTSSAVQIHLSPSFVLSSASDNHLPLTIENHLRSSVKVKVVFVSENPQRLSVPPTGVVTVPAGESVTVTFDPRAETNGTLGVTAQLQTASGRAIGSPVQTTMTATSIGRAGWIIVIASGAVLLGATAWRIRQVQRDGERATLSADTGSTTDGPTPEGSTDEGPRGGEERHE